MFLPMLGAALMLVGQPGTVPPPAEALPPDPVHAILLSAQRPEEPNTWDLVAGLIDRWRSSGEAGRDFHDAALNRPLDDAAHARIAAFEAAADPTIADALRSLSSSRHCLAPAGTPRGLDARTDASSALLFHAYIAIAGFRRGDPEGLEEALALARHCALQGSFSDLYAAGIILEIALRAAQDSARNGRSAPDLISLGHAAERQRIEAPRSLWLDAELALTHQTIDRLIAADRPVPDAPPAELAAFEAALGDPARIHDAAELIFDAAQRREFPPHPALPAVAADILGASMNDAAHLGGHIDRVQALSEGMRAALVLAAFRLERRDMPRRLEDLLGEFIDRMPIDPATGAALVYRAPPEGPILYSVGSDGRDDGGRMDPDVPRRAFTPAGVGYDYIIFR